MWNNMRAVGCALCLRVCKGQARRHEQQAWPETETQHARKHTQNTLTHVPVRAPTTSTLLVVTCRATAC